MNDQDEDAQQAPRGLDRTNSVAAAGQRRRQHQPACDNNSTTNCSETMSDEENNSPRASSQLAAAAATATAASLASRGNHGQVSGAPVSGHQLERRRAADDQIHVGASREQVATRRQWSPVDESDQNTTTSMNETSGSSLAALVEFSASSADQQLPPSYRTVCTNSNSNNNNNSPLESRALTQHSTTIVASATSGPHHFGPPEALCAALKSGPQTNAPQPQPPTTSAMENRWISVDLNAATSAGANNHLSMQQQQQPDNNRAANNFNGRPQQQQHQFEQLKQQPGLFAAAAAAANLPINHVISAEGSMRHQWQANQYYASGGGGGGFDGFDGRTGSYGNDYVTHQQLHPEQQPSSSLWQPHKQWRPHQQPPNQNENENQNPNQSAPGATRHQPLTGGANFLYSARERGDAEEDEEEGEEEGEDEEEGRHCSISAALNQSSQGAAPAQQARGASAGAAQERQSRAPTKQRKRRRHRSATSGRQTTTNLSAAAAAAAATATTMRHQHQNENELQQQQHLPQSISAHCWLIDSGDEQVSSMRRHHQARPGAAAFGLNGIQQSGSSAAASSFSLAARLAAADSAPLSTYGGGGGGGHLTVAMMRQSEQQQQRQRSKTLDYRKLLHQQQPRPSAQTGAQRQHQQSATNSLRMHRTTTSGRPASGHASCSFVAPTQAQVLLPGERLSRGRHRRARRNSSSSSSSGSSSSGCCAHRADHRQEVDAARQTTSANAGVILRLSAILSMASRLVGRSTGGKQPRPAHRGRANSADRCGHAHSPSHISGTASAPYTAAVGQHGLLAISSSSSTSAYATGSSLHSSSSVGQQQQLQHQRQRLLQLNVINQHQHQQQQPPISMTQLDRRHASSLQRTLYGPPPPPSSHAYEYCGDDDLANQRAAPNSQETKFTTKSLEKQQQQQKQQPNLQSSSASCCSAESSPSSSLPTNDDDDGMRTSGDQLRPMPTQSDHELISAGSLERNHADSAAASAAVFGLSGGRLRAETLADRRRAGGAASGAQRRSSRRRRWWWLSFKNWLRRPCSSGSHSESLNLPTSAAAAQAMISSQEQAALATVASYKSLRSSARNGGGGGGRRTFRGSCSDTSTISNVISLAKADRAFRLRLVASVLVSCLLLALICLLAAVVYTRSASAGAGFLAQNRNRLNLLVDDSDYDLSWLWPQTGAAQTTSSPSSGQSFGRTTDLPAYRQLVELEQQLANNPNQRSPTSNTESGTFSLRKHLIMIEQSERLEQFQLTLAHLTGIQLANDQFVDAIQLIDNLSSSSRQLANSSERNNKQRYEQADLVYVTLLSNLHWPLVKWRHQNQQSVASFLSAFASTSSAYPGSQNLRNLLSLLMLAESRPQSQDSPSGTSSSPEAHLMRQIYRLNNLLRTVSNQLIGCRTETIQSRHQLRDRFCEKLLAKYQRMMVMLGQLNHSHLAKLQSPSNIELRRGVSAPTTSSQRSNTKTLIGFFLDRLALLDVQLLAEEILAATSPSSSSSIEGLLMVLRQQQTAAGAESSAEDMTRKLIDTLVLHQDSGSNSSPDDNSNSNNQGSSSSPLFELAKLSVGESPANLRINPSTKETREFVAKLQQLEHEDPQSWHRALTRGILFPWSVRQLPQLLLESAPADINYDLFLHANLSSKFIQGMVKIEFRLRRSCRFLILNSAELNLADTTLWLKQDDRQQQQQQQQRHFRQTNQSSSSSNRLNEEQQQTFLPDENSVGGGNLREIPIRRLLRNANLEQVYIELQDLLESHSTWTNLDSDNLADTSGVNFGDLSISISGRPQSKTTIRTQNVYVLSVAFNKTSLQDDDQNNKKSSRSIKQDEESEDSSRRGEEAEDEGNDEEQEEQEEEAIKFVHYGDYFAQSETAEAKTMLLSQFEPTKARQVFPCFDEPKFKAQFQLNLVHASQHQAISNAPKRERIPYTSDGSLQMSVFEPTPIPLSTYLVSFMIFDSNNIKSVASRIPREFRRQLTQSGQVAAAAASDQQTRTTTTTTSTNLTSGGGSSSKHIQIQILAQFEHLGQTELAASLVPQLLSFFQSYLQFAYPCDKLDLVAVPFAELAAQSVSATAAAAARQNRKTVGRPTFERINGLGLIWLRASQLIVDTNLISQDLIEQTSMTLAHQLAHQYFGNIITISEWSPPAAIQRRGQQQQQQQRRRRRRRGQDLWLYEALCQYLESLAMARVQPDWRLEEQFPVTSIQETLEAEQYQSRSYAESYSSSSSSSSSSSVAGSSRRPTSGAEQPLDLLQQQPTQRESWTANGNVSRDETTVIQESESLVSMAAEQQQQHQDAADTESHLELSQQGAFIHELGQQQQPLLLDEDVEVEQHVEMELERKLDGRMADADTATRRGSQRNSAVLHMFLFNLLPTQEAQGRLLRNCLSQFQLSHSKTTTTTNTMSLGQFWRQFGLQLRLEASYDRLSLDVSRLFTKENTSPSADNQQSALDLDEASWSSFGQQQQETNERVVFVRKHSQTRTSSSNNNNYLANQQLDREAAAASSGGLAENLELVANMWLDRSGYPLISVTAYRDRIHLKQELFSSNWWIISRANNNLNLFEDSQDQAADPESSQTLNSNGMKSDEKSGQDMLLPPIPLMFVSRYNPKLARFLWMFGKEMEIPYGEQQMAAFASAAPSQPPSQSQSQAATTRGPAFHPGWLKLNVNQSSLVRVNYDERLWAALSDLLIKSHYSNHVLNSLDRANLIDDALTLMRCGKLSVGLAMNLTLYLEVGERDFMPWTVALRHLDQMQTMLNQNPLWHRYVLRLLQPISSVIGWKDDGPHLMRKLRRHLFSVALQYGDEKAIAKARQEFKAWMRSGHFIVPNLQELVYVAGVRYGDQQEWFHCWKRYQELVGSSSSSSSSSSFQSQSSGDGSSSDPSDQRAAASARANNHLQANSGNFGGGQNRLQSVVGLAASPSFLADVATAGGGSSQDFANGIGMESEANVESEKNQLLTALASTQNIWLIEQFLNYSLDATKVEQSHLKHIIQVLGKNPVARLYLWRFVRLNWFHLFESYSSSSSSSRGSQEESRSSRFEHQRQQQRRRGGGGGGNQILETMVIQSTRHFATKLDYDEVKTFFDTKRRQHYLAAGGAAAARWNSDLELAMHQSLQIIQSNIHWRNIVEPKLTNWLSHFGSR